MSYLTHLKRNKHHYANRWIVKYDDEGLVREVKLIFNPEEYRKGKRARKVVEDFDLGYNTGVAVSYLLRAGKKPGNPAQQDIQKAINHLHFELDKLYKESETTTGAIQL